MANNLYIIDGGPNGEKTYDLESRLLEDRIIIFNDEVNNHSASICIQELLLLNNKNKENPISLYITTPGGSCSDGLGIIDTINAISAPVYTFAIGTVASMGVAILTSGAKGHRYSLPNAEIMAHRSSAGIKGNIQDAAVTWEHWISTDDRLNDIISKNIGVSKEQYVNSLVRDKWMWPEEAIKFGFIDKIFYGRIGAPIPPQEVVAPVASEKKSKTK